MKWLSCFALLFSLPILSATAGDWPNLLGPSHNGYTSEALPERLSPEWKPIWTLNTGQGFAAPVVKGDTVVLFDRVDGAERLRAIQANDGSVRWTASFPARYRGTINPDSGPRATPLIHEDSVYVLGAAGHTHAVNLADGTIRWSRDLGKEVDADEGYFGVGQTPLVLQDVLVINPGGEDGKGLMGLDLRTGKTRWAKTDAAPSYSATVPWKENAIAVTRLETFGLTPTGDVLWTIPFGKRGPTVNGAAPLLVGDRLVLSASYGIGARVYALEGANEPRLLWQNDSSLSSQYPTPVAVDGHLYGIHGREDYNNGVFHCVELETGKVKWSRLKMPMTQSITDGKRLLSVTLDGHVLLLDATPKGFTSRGELVLAKGIYRSYPAFSNGVLYLLSHPDDGRPGTLIALPVN